jgi:hypothetical protein
MNLAVNEKEDFELISEDNRGGSERVFEEAKLEKKESMKNVVVEINT